jgi:hypothetical protein
MTPIVSMDLESCNLGCASHRPMLWCSYPPSAANAKRAMAATDSAGIPPPTPTDVDVGDAGFDAPMAAVSPVDAERHVSRRSS